MPRTAYFSKEAIVSKGLELVREQGADALSARSLSKALNCSISPLFTVFDNMEQIKTAVRKAASDMFADYIADVSDYTPAFKEFGLRMVRFASHEYNLFRMLFLDGKPIGQAIPDKAKECLEGIESAYGINEEQADVLFRQMWTFACGLAVIKGGQNSESYNEDEISEMLSCQFSSMMYFLKSGRDIINVQPRLRREGENNTLDI